MGRFNRQWLIRIVSFFVAGMILTVPATEVMAADQQTTFIAGYEHNAQTEAELLQTANASSVSNEMTTVYSNVVSQLNDQILSLYATEQAVANVEATKPTIDLNLNNISATSLQAHRNELVTGLTNLQMSIKQLQASSIYYTKAWIASEQT